jgi:hypothetical protein
MFFTWYLEIVMLNMLHFDGLFKSVLTKTLLIFRLKPQDCALSLSGLCKRACHLCASVQRSSPSGTLFHSRFGCQVHSFVLIPL